MQAAESVNQWVVEAIRLLNLSLEEFQEFDTSKSLPLIQEVKQRFVKGNPRAWWLSLKNPFTAFVIDDSYGVSGSVDYLDELLPSKEPVYLFIPENEDGDYKVFQTTLHVIKQILLECPSFEYYLLPLHLSWLLCENDHHGEVIVSWFNEESWGASSGGDTTKWLIM